MDEKELQEKLVLIRQYQMQADALAQQITLAQTSIAEHDKAIITIKGIKDLEEGNELVVPIGAGSYIYAKLCLVDRVVIELGSGVNAEKDPLGAVAILEERREDIGQSLKSLDETIVKIEQEAQKLQSEVQSEINMAQQQQALNR